MNRGETILKTAPPGRRFLVLTLLITLFALVLRSLMLSSQTASIDDFGVGLTAINFVESGQQGPVMWNHPDLSYIIVYYAVKLFGSGVLGIKGHCVALGTLSVTLVALVGRRVTRSETVALLAAALWAVDGLSIDLSRQAVHEIYQSFFPLAGLYLALRFRASGRSLWLAGSGLVFGLGIACKWNSLFPLLATLAWLSLAAWRDAGLDLPGRAVRVVHAAALLLVLPATVYLLTYLPWFARGYTLQEWGGLQRSMYQETSTHMGYKGNVKGDAEPALWFLVPVSWDDLIINMETDPKKPASEQSDVMILMGLTNPLVWLLVLPGLFFTLRRGLREGDEGLLLIGSVSLAAYLPLLVVSVTRPIWACTALSVMPFAIIPVAYFLENWFSRFGDRKRALLTGYLVLVALVAVPLYLLAIGKGLEMPVAGEYLQHRLETKGY